MEVIISTPFYLLVFILDKIGDVLIILKRGRRYYDRTYRITRESQ